jgi:hypothetical protein
MPRSIPLLAALLGIAACAQPSQSSVVTAPSDVAASSGATVAPRASATPLPGPATPSTATPPASAISAPPSDASSPPPAASGGANASTVPAQYRACSSDADCVAVPRAVCCNHGWKEAVAVTEKDAYARDFACKQVPRPMCPMFIVRDARVAKCDTQQKLCVMTGP